MDGLLDTIIQNNGNGKEGSDDDEGWLDIPAEEDQEDSTTAADGAMNDEDNPANVVVAEREQATMKRGRGR